MAQPAIRPSHPQTDEPRKREDEVGRPVGGSDIFVSLPGFKDSKTIAASEHCLSTRSAEQLRICFVVFLEQNT
jgi:hypothetical protein